MIVAYLARGKFLSVFVILDVETFSPQPRGLPIEEMYLKSRFLTRFRRGDIPHHLGRPKLSRPRASLA